MTDHETATTPVIFAGWSPPLQSSSIPFPAISRAPGCTVLLRSAQSVVSG